MLTPREGRQLATPIIIAARYRINGEDHVPLYLVLEQIKNFTDPPIDFVKEADAYTIKLTTIAVPETP